MLSPGGQTVGMLTAFYTLGANSTGTINFTYVLTDNVDHKTDPNVNSIFRRAGDGQSTATPRQHAGKWTVLVLEDKPIAHDEMDSDEVAEKFDDGNVITGRRHV